MIRVADKLADRVAELMCRPWSPVGRRIWLEIDDPRDAGLTGVTVYGWIRGVAAPDGLLTDLLIELERPFTFGEAAAIDGGVRHHVDSLVLNERSPLRELVRSDGIRWLVTRPCVKWRRTSRIRFSWAVARFMAATSFADARFESTVGVGRIGLSKS